MSDLIDRLTGLTPSAGGLDRDALLFEAGRASAPSTRRAWALAGLLALTQLLTLLPWRAPTPPAPPAVPTPAETPAAGGRLEVRHPSEETPTDDPIPDAPPLRAVDRSLFTSLTDL